MKLFDLYDVEPVPRWRTRGRGALDSIQIILRIAIARDRKQRPSAKSSRCLSVHWNGGHEGGTSISKNLRVDGSRMLQGLCLHSTGSLLFDAADLHASCQRG